MAIWRFLKKLKIELPYDPAIPLLGIYPEKTVICKPVSDTVVKRFPCLALPQKNLHRCWDPSWREFCSSPGTGVSRLYLNEALCDSEMPGWRNSMLFGQIYEVQGSVLSLKVKRFTVQLGDREDGQKVKIQYKQKSLLIHILWGVTQVGQQRSMLWGGRWERGSCLGMHVHPWWIHVNIWQNQYSIVK